MTALRQQMLEEMQLRGLSSRTQQSYLGAVRQVAEYYHKPPQWIQKAADAFSLSARLRMADSPCLRLS